jgi:hypothetical protein
VLENLKGRDKLEELGVDYRTVYLEDIRQEGVH